jgi:hypothetical protein
LIMSYGNPLHVDSNGERVTTPGDTMPVVAADKSKTHLPAHIPVRPSGLCSIMCDHPGIVREASHQAAVDSWKREADK